MTEYDFVYYLKDFVPDLSTVHRWLPFIALGLSINNGIHGAVVAIVDALRDGNATLRECEDHLKDIHSKLQDIHGSLPDVSPFEAL